MKSDHVNTDNKIRFIETNIIENVIEIVSVHTLSIRTI